MAFSGFHRRDDINRWRGDPANGLDRVASKKGVRLEKTNGPAARLLSRRIRFNVAVFRVVFSLFDDLFGVDVIVTFGFRR